MLEISLVTARRYDEARAQVEHTLATGGDPEFAHAALLLWGRRMDELGLPNGYDPAADTYEPVAAP